MADTLIERVTGRPAEQAVPVAVNLVLSDQALLGVENAPAAVAGYGTVPSAIAQQLIACAVTDGASSASLRRLYASPASGALVAMESRARIFPKGLAEFIGLRDQRCRTPYCDAPIRHRDHARPHRRGGATPVWPTQPRQPPRAPGGPRAYRRWLRRRAGRCRVRRRGGPGQRLRPP